jgi:hypothetical protein
MLQFYFVIRVKTDIQCAIIVPRKNLYMLVIPAQAGISLNYQSGFPPARE